MAFRSFRLALIQLGNIGHNKAENLRHAREMIVKAVSSASKKPDVVVLPECFNSPYGHTHFPVYAERIGYTPGTVYDATKHGGESVQMLSSVAKEVKTWLIGGSIPERDADDRIYNTCTVYNPEGELVAMHRKVHLFDIDIPGKIRFKESETLSGGTTVNAVDMGFAKIGLGICYDIRFPELAMIAARQGCQMLIYPGAFNMTTGPMHWELLQRARAVDNQVYVAMCSPARDVSAGYQAWGHSMAVNAMGEVVAEAGDGEEIVYADIVADSVLAARAAIPVTVQRRFDVYSDVSLSQHA